MQYWLMKSEPGEFSIDDLERVGTEPWDGIRNYQARNFMRDEMKVGDRVLFYHSSCKVPGVVGLMKVASKAYPDPTQFDPENSHYDAKSNPDDPTWLLVDVEFVKKFKQPVTLEAIRREQELSDMRLVKRGNRLSIFPVDKVHWDHILDMSKR